MKRAASSLTITLGVPAIVLFALTAGPARLYAESGVRFDPPQCTAPEVVACGDASADAACTVNGTTGVCRLTTCTEQDGGTDASLGCYPPVAKSEPPSGADAGAPVDGGTLGATPPPAGSGSSEGCSCAMVSSRSSALGSSIGLLIAALATMRRRRRRD